MKFAEAYVELMVNKRKLDADMRQSKTIVSRGMSNIVGMAKTAGAAIGAYLGARVLFRGIRSMVTSAAEGEEALAVLEAVLAATGHAAGWTAKELDSIANQMQKVTKYSDEEVKSIMAIVGSFKEIKGDQFIEATKAIMDMSTVMKQDARSGAIQLGKALNDPILGVTALGRTGVQFTQTQKEMIKQLVESGRMLDAQNMILKELQTEFGGAAEAAGTTLAGQLTIAENAFDDLKESMGGAFAEGADLTGMLNQMRDASDANTSALSAMAKGLGWAFNKIVNGLQFLYIAFKSYTLGIQRVWMEMAETVIRTSGVLVKGLRLAGKISPAVGAATAGNLNAAMGWIQAQQKKNTEDAISVAKMWDQLLTANMPRAIPGAGAGGGGLAPRLPGAGEAGATRAAATALSTVRSASLGTLAARRAGPTGEFSLAGLRLPTEKDAGAKEDTQKELLVATREVAKNTRQPPVAVFGG